MTDSKDARRALKDACLALLDSVAGEHPSGHQSKLAARYLIISQSGERIGLMFEKHVSASAHVWISRHFAQGLADGIVPVREYKAEQLYQSVDTETEPTYGRHAALKSMRDIDRKSVV